MKVATISDCHILTSDPICRIDDAKLASINKFKFVLEYCKKNKIDHLFVAGDLTHSPRMSWSLLEITKAIYDSDLNVYAVYGQHDMYLRNKERTFLNLLSSSGLVRILDSIPITIGDYNFYGTSFSEEVPKPKTKNNVLVIHASISPTKLFPTHERIKPNTFLKKHKRFDLVFCGDIHRKFIEEYNSRLILNTGNMVRYTADEYNLKHKPCFFIVDLNDFQIEEILIPAEKSKDVISTVHLEKKEELQEVNNEIDDFITEVNLSKNKKDDINSDFYSILNSLIDKIKGTTDINKRAIEIIQYVMR